MKTCRDYELLGGEYADRLVDLQEPRWKRALDVQRPYRWNLRRLKPGRMLDVGCGSGRSLAHVSDAVGVDPNEICVRVARCRGFEAYTPSEFTFPKESFDSLLVAHVLEHLTAAQAHDLFLDYLPYLKPGGQVIMLTPQEKCFSMDRTHIRFMDFSTLADLAQEWELAVERAFSFPFPRWAGRIFPYNEFVLTARKQTQLAGECHQVLVSEHRAGERGGVDRGRCGG
jgi:SAM-dependent methyltransferase